MRSFVLACSCLLACAEVTVVPNDGGGSADDGAGGDTSVGAGTPGVGGGGSGGGAIAEPRAIEIALIGGEGGDIAGIGVLVNRADGSLKTSYSGSELPVMAEVVDGDMVSFSVPDFESEIRLSSYRVRPGVWRIAEEGPPGGAGCTELEPMSLTFEIPTVEGAEAYHVHAPMQVWLKEPGMQTIELTACTTDEPLPVLVVASTNAAGSEKLAYGLLELSYVPGAAVVLPLELVADRQDITLVTSGSEALVNGWWIPNARPFPWGSSNSDWQSSPEGFVGSIIAPGGGFTWMNVFASPAVTADGWCAGAHQQLKILSTPGPVTVDASTVDLAQPILLEDDSVAFGDGPRGDSVYREFYNDIDVYYWGLYDDPAAEWLPVVFPELPPGDPWSLDPGGPLASHGAGHVDHDVIDGYADYVSKLEPTLFSPKRSRSIGACD